MGILIFARLKFINIIINDTAIFLDYDLRNSVDTEPRLRWTRTSLDPDLDFIEEQGFLSFL